MGWRVQQLESNYKEIDQKLDQIMTNEIPHLQEEIVILKNTVRNATIFNVGAIIMALVISRYLIP